VAVFLYKETIMTEPVYGDLHDITIDGIAYQIQSVDMDFDTSFIVKKVGKYYCKIFFNEESEWETDCPISEQEFATILQKIKELYEL
jgi:hypothetical protein